MLFHSLSYNCLRDYIFLEEGENLLRASGPSAWEALLTLTTISYSWVGQRNPQTAEMGVKLGNRVTEREKNPRRLGCSCLDETPSTDGDNQEKLSPGHRYAINRSPMPKKRVSLESASLGTTDCSLLSLSKHEDTPLLLLLHHMPHGHLVQQLTRALHSAQS